MKCFGKVVYEKSGYDVVEIIRNNNLTVEKYSIIYSGKCIEFSETIDYLIEVIDAKTILTNIRNSEWVPKNGIMMGPTSYIIFPICRAIMLLLTFGKYPPKNKEYNPRMVMALPFVIVFTLLVVFYS